MLVTLTSASEGDSGESGDGVISESCNGVRERVVNLVRVVMVKESESCDGDRSEGESESCDGDKSR